MPFFYVCVFAAHQQKNMLTCKTSSGHARTGNVHPHVDRGCRDRHVAQEDAPGRARKPGPGRGGPCGDQQRRLHSERDHDPQRRQLVPLPDRAIPALHAHRDAEDHRVHGQRRVRHVRRHWLRRTRGEAGPAAGVRRIIGSVPVRLLRVAGSWKRTMRARERLVHMHNRHFVSFTGLEVREACMFVFRCQYN
jgi:hypothetical protein